MNYETATEIELAIAKSFGTGQNIIVPNVSWGFLLPYVADLLILTKSNYLWEIEIKVSRGDLLRDGKKYHQHDSQKVRELWFAIPKKLECCADKILNRAGVFIVHPNGYVTVHKTPTINRLACKLSDKECFKLARLGALRVWTLKKKIYEMEIAQQSHETG